MPMLRRDFIRRSAAAAAAAVSCNLPMTSSRFCRESGHCTPPMHGDYDAISSHYLRSAAPELSAQAVANGGSLLLL